MSLPLTSRLSRRIGVSSLSGRFLPFDTFARIASDSGLSEVDVVMVPGFCDHIDIVERDRTRIDAVRMSCERWRLNVGAVVVIPSADIRTDPHATNAVRDQYGFAAEAASALGAPLLITDAGSPLEPGPAGRTEGIHAWLRRMETVREVADGQRLTVAVEMPHRYTLAQSWSELQDMLPHLETYGFGVDFDTSHIAGARADLTEAWEILVPLVSHVALRDVDAQGTFTVPGQGVLEIATFLTALGSYTGPCMLELETPGRTTAESLAGDLTAALDYLQPVLRWDDR